MTMDLMRIPLAMQLLVLTLLLTTVTSQSMTESLKTNVLTTGAQHSITSPTGGAQAEATHTLIVTSIVEKETNLPPDPSLDEATPSTIGTTATGTQQSVVSNSTSQISAAKTEEVLVTANLPGTSLVVESATVTGGEQPSAESQTSQKVPSSTGAQRSRLPRSADPNDTAGDIFTESGTVPYEGADITSPEELMDLGTSTIRPEVQEGTLDARACFNNACYGNGDCILQDTAKGFDCECREGYSGSRCQVYTNPCSAIPCDVNELCMPLEGLDFTCTEVNMTTPATPLSSKPLSLNTAIAITCLCVLPIVFLLFTCLLLWCTTWRNTHREPLCPCGQNEQDKYWQEKGDTHFDSYNRKLSKIYMISNGGTTERISHLEEKWVIADRDLEMGKLLYSGEFSYVCEGELRDRGDGKPLKVAIKLLKDGNDHESMMELSNEFQVLANMGKHPNILTLLGQCNRHLEQSFQTCLVVEYVARSDMLRILRRCRSRKRDQPPLDPLPQEELLSFACDIAQGMRHVAALRYVYMNLCAKNVLITFNNKAKLCDFSMAVEVQKPNVPIPFLEPRNRGLKRWMAYEALIEGQYTMKSDVWSYGIVLWEIVTLGGVPYADKREADVINELRDHNRLEWPKHCSPELYDIMLRCWHRRPESRPTFDRIFKDMKALKNNGQPHINLKDYVYQMYAPIRLDLEPTTAMTDSFV